MNTKEMIAVMQAYEDGKQIEYNARNGWRDVTIPVWDWHTKKYRIKATKKPVDLSVPIESGIDVEVSVNDKWRVGKLETIIPDSDNQPCFLIEGSSRGWTKCRPRMNHIHAFKSGHTRILDELGNAGFDTTHSFMQMDGTYTLLVEFHGLKYGYCYPWECDE